MNLANIRPASQVQQWARFLLNESNHDTGLGTDTKVSTVVWVVLAYIIYRCI